MTDQELIALTLKATATVLSRRLLLVLGLVSTFVMALWAMWEPTWLHAAVAGGYGVLSWVYCTLSEHFRKD